MNFDSVWLGISSDFAEDVQFDLKFVVKKENDRNMLSKAAIVSAYMHRFKYINPFVNNISTQFDEFSTILFALMRSYRMHCVKHIHGGTAMRQ